MYSCTSRFCKLLLRTELPENCMANVEAVNGVERAGVVLLIVGVFDVSAWYCCPVAVPTVAALSVVSVYTQRL
jgi:hypothetical protein